MELDGTVFHHKRIPVGRRELYSPEDLGFLKPSLRISEDLCLYVFIGWCKGFFSKSSVAKTNGEIKGVDLFTCHEVLGRIQAGSLWIHNSQRKSWSVFTLREKAVFDIKRLVPIPAARRCLEGFHSDNFRHPPVNLQTREKPQCAIVIAVRGDFSKTKPVCVLFHYPRSWNLHQSSSAPICRSQKWFISGVCNRWEKRERR